MKALRKLVVVILFALVIVACKNESTPEVKTVDVTATEVKAELDPNATYAKAEFTIEGMTCEMGCAKTIEKKLAGMEGVKSAKVDFEAEMAMVEFDEAKVTPNALEETVSNVGATYSVKNMRTVESFEAKAPGTGKDKAHVCKNGEDCCKGKSEAEKKDCSEACKKDCCAEKKDKA